MKMICNDDEIEKKWFITYFMKSEKNLNDEVDDLPF